jgi:hypothetical protein
MFRMFLVMSVLSACSKPDTFLPANFPVKFGQQFSEVSKLPDAICDGNFVPSTLTAQKHVKTACKIPMDITSYRNPWFGFDQDGVLSTIVIPFKDAHTGSTIDVSPSTYQGVKNTLVDKFGEPTKDEDKDDMWENKKEKAWLLRFEEGDGFVVRFLVKLRRPAAKISY